MARRSAPTPEQLDDMVRFIGHDVWMMGQCAYIAGSVPDKLRVATSDLHIAEPALNAVVESFCLHLRNILAFLYPPPVKMWRDGDVYAADYSQEAARVFDVNGQDAQAWMREVSQRILHVHEQRSAEWDGWPAWQLLGGSWGALKDWIDRIGEPYGPQFMAELRRREVHYGVIPNLG